MPDRDGKSRVKWMMYGAAISTVVDMPAAFYVAHEIARGDQAEAAFREWIELRPRAAVAFDLITRHEHTVSGRRRKPQPYSLSLSSESQIAGEAELYLVLDFFEFRGSQICRGRIDPAQFSSYLGDAPRDWLRALEDLRDRSRDRPALDGDRYEQLTHVITALRVLANVDLDRISFLDWRPICMENERLIDDDETRETTFEVSLQNRNLASSPIPGLCIECRNEIGERVGQWLIYPSDAFIPALSAIEVRGRIAWPEAGRPAALRFVETVEDQYGAGNLRGRFPGPGGSTWLSD